MTLGPEVTTQEAAPWVVTTARNLVFAARRTAARRWPLRPLRTSGLDGGPAVEWKLKVADANGRLGEGDRRVFAMVVDGYSTQEIAAATGVGDRAVRKAIARIREVCGLCGISPGEFRAVAVRSDDGCEAEP